MTHEDTAASHGEAQQSRGDPQACCALPSTRVHSSVSPATETQRSVMSLPGEAPKRLGTQVSRGTGHRAPLPGTPRRFRLPAGKPVRSVVRAARAQPRAGNRFSVREWWGHSCPQMPAKAQPCKQACGRRSRAWRLLLSSQAVLAFPRKLNIYRFLLARCRAGCCGCSAGQTHPRPGQRVLSSGRAQVNKIVNAQGRVQAPKVPLETPVRRCDGRERAGLPRLPGQNA